MKMCLRSRDCIRILLLASLIVFVSNVSAECQKLSRALIITGNGNIPEYKNGYPPWIHEFHNEKVSEILEGIVNVDLTTDLSVLQTERLHQYDLIISNSLFLTPTKEQLDALYQFVSNGKSYLTLHCGILSLLNWEKYEEFIGGIFIGGPASVPGEFNVVTANIEFWGYPYSFRNESDHPISLVVDDFVTRDELYHFQPSTRNFHVIARAENFPVMWWHPVGKGKVMSLTLGHDETAKNNPGYQNLLKSGVQWLVEIPLILGRQPNVVSNRQLAYENFLTLKATTYTPSKSIRFNVIENSTTGIFTAQSTALGQVDLRLTGKPGSGKFIVSATPSNGTVSKRTFDIRVVQDGTGNIASYHGNTAISSSNENDSGMFDAGNVLDDDISTRWSSAPRDSAWIVIDLQKVYKVKKLVLAWESSFASKYDVLGSQNGKIWNSIATVSDGDGETDTLDFHATDIRYVKINATQRANNKWGYSLYEIKIYE